MRWLVIYKQVEDRTMKKITALIILITLSLNSFAELKFYIKIPQPDYISNDWDGDGISNADDFDDDGDGVNDVDDSTPFGGKSGNAVEDDETTAQIKDETEGFGITTVIVKSPIWSADPHEANTITGMLCGGITTCTRYDGNYRGLYSSGKQIDIEFDSAIKINGLKLSLYAWQTPKNISIQYENSSGQYIEFFDYMSPGASTSNPEYEYILTEVSFPDVTLTKIRFIGDSSNNHIWMGYLEPLFTE
jgi:hypothetical protein